LADRAPHNDKPITAPSEDRYGIDPFAKALASSIRKLAAPEGTVIALNGPFGSGKSSAVNLVLHVEVRTYLHQSWPSLVEDIERQPPGTRTVVVGYSLGANSSVFVANKAKYVDLIIALQPSMFSWNPSVTGNVGRMIEIYNPNRWMTFGGMGSNKLVGPNIEYIANNDSHPGAQFNPVFRNLVKTEVAKLSSEDESPPENRLEAEAQCDSCKALY
jgi:hypothetical protein